MTGGTKAVVWDAVYRPFGEVHAITGSASNNLRFPGQYFQLEAGLHYNWHCHYEPTLGRYLQADPLEFVGGPALYSYARSRPTTEIDPDGQVPVAIPVIVGARLFCMRYPHLCAAAAGAAVNGILKTFRLPNGSGGNDKDCPRERCLDRWETEYARCEMFRPYGYRYQLACQTRANDRLSLCYRNGGKPNPNEPPEYDWKDIPRDAPSR
jgi:RHS repeat-associated protein